MKLSLQGKPLEETSYIWFVDRFTIVGVLFAGFEQMECETTEIWSKIQPWWKCEIDFCVKKRSFCLSQANSLNGWVKIGVKLE